MKNWQMKLDKKDEKKEKVMNLKRKLEQRKKK